MKKQLEASTLERRLAVQRLAKVIGKNPNPEPTPIPKRVEPKGGGKKVETVLATTTA